MSCEVCHDMVQVDAIIDHWGANPEFAVEMMQDVQDRFRHLPKAALERMNERTGADMGRLYHVATFFKAFSLEPRGEIPIAVCTGTACHVRGAARVLDAFARELGVEPGGTTQDLKFTLEGVRCLGCCGLAPVVTMGPDLHGSIDSSRVQRLLKKYRKPGSTQPEAGAKENIDA
jgi:NADH-quinone oxidoreductase subunit E